MVIKLQLPICLNLERRGLQHRRKSLDPNVICSRSIPFKFLLYFGIILIFYFKKTQALLVEPKHSLS